MQKSPSRVSEIRFPVRHRPHSPRAEAAQEITLDPVERLLTIRDLASSLRLSRKTIERMVRAGRLPSLRVCGRVRFRPSDIASWLAAREDRACHGS